MNDRTITINIRAITSGLTSGLNQSKAAIKDFGTTSAAATAQAEAGLNKVTTAATTTATVEKDLSAKSYMAARGLQALGLEGAAAGVRIAALGDVFAMVGRALPQLLAIGVAVTAISSAFKGLQDSVNIAISVDDSLSRIKEALNLQPAAWEAMRDQVMQTADAIAVASGTSIDKTMDSLAQLIVRTHDVTLSEKALAVASEVAVATHKDLQTVTYSLIEAVGGYGVMLERLDPKLKNMIAHGATLEQLLDQLHKDYGNALQDTHDFTRETSMQDASVSVLQQHLGSDFIPMLGALHDAWDAVKIAAIGFSDSLVDVVSGSVETLIGLVTTLYHGLMAAGDAFSHNFVGAISEAKAAWASMHSIGKGFGDIWSGLTAPATFASEIRNPVERTQATAARVSTGAEHISSGRGLTPEQKLAAAELAHQMSMLAEEYSKGRISLADYDAALDKIKAAHKNDAALGEHINSLETKASMFPPSAQRAATDALDDAKTLIEAATLAAQDRVDLAKDRVARPEDALRAWDQGGKYYGQDLTANTEREKAQLLTQEIGAQKGVLAALIAQQKAEQDAAQRYRELAQSHPRQAADLQHGAAQHTHSANQIAEQIQSLAATISSLRASLATLPAEMAAQAATRQRAALQTALDAALASNREQQESLRSQMSSHSGIPAGARTAEDRMNAELQADELKINLAQLAAAAAQDQIAFYQHTLALDESITNQRARISQETRDKDKLSDAEAALALATTDLTQAQQRYLDTLKHQLAENFNKSLAEKLPGASLNQNQQLSFNPYQFLLQVIEQTKSFADVMQVVNTVMKVFAQVIDAFRPVIDDLLMIVVGVVKVFIDLWNAIARVMSLLGIHIQQLSLLNTETEPLVQIYHDLPTLQQLKSGNKETFQSIYDADDTQLDNMLYSQQLGGGLFGVLGEILAAILALKAIMGAFGSSFLGGSSGGFLGGIVNFIKGLFGGGSSGGYSIPSNISVPGGGPGSVGAPGVFDTDSAIKLDWVDANTQSAINPITVTLDDESMQAVSQGASSAAASAADAASGATTGTNSLAGITGSVSSVAGTATKVLSGIGDAFGIYSGFKQGGVMGGITAGFSADSLALLLGATGPIGIAAGIGVGLLSMLLGGKGMFGPNPANEPDISNTQAWGQENANLWGAGVQFKQKMNANGQQFKMNSNLASETGGMGLLQYIASYIGSSGSASAKTLLGGLYSTFAGLNPDKIDVKSGKNGQLDLANGVTIGYQQLYQEAMQALKLIQGAGTGPMANLAEIAQSITRALPSTGGNGLTGPYGMGAEPLTPQAIGEAVAQAVVPAIEQQTDTLHDDLADANGILEKMGQSKSSTKATLGGVAVDDLNNLLALSTIRVGRNRAYELGGAI